ncbi:hypothetical protein [Streptomyces griseorubiginosus]|uniref:hypothetical protein n=1 Tax=Streptomyces griseorubiginosus TaxID=67304 RepID=UPI00076BC577|nr:hypothetical protein [Streptomyces griseorubiginosus]KUM75813.1 hypothetical protein AQI84_19010 [Streptomyces griseorubiginosus]
MRSRTAAALAVLTLLTASACASHPAPGTDDVIKAATRKLTDDCLTRQGLSPESDRQRVADALFGTGPSELSLRLPTGYTVRAHTDGCLAAAQRRLYGDQDRWFHTSVVVNNLQPEAARTGRPLSEVRAAHRAELTEWRRLRARALTQATALLEGGDITRPSTTHPKGNQ